MAINRVRDHRPKASYATPLPSPVTITFSDGRPAEIRPPYDASESSSIVQAGYWKKYQRENPPKPKCVHVWSDWVDDENNPLKYRVCIDCLKRESKTHNSQDRRRYRRNSGGFKPKIRSSGGGSGKAGSGG